MLADSSSAQLLWFRQKSVQWRSLGNQQQLLSPTTVQCRGRGALKVKRQGETVQGESGKNERLPKGRSGARVRKAENTKLPTGQLPFY